MSPRFPSVLLALPALAALACAPAEPRRDTAATSASASELPSLDSLANAPLPGASTANASTGSSPATATPAASSGGAAAGAKTTASRPATPTATSTAPASATAGASRVPGVPGSVAAAAGAASVRVFPFEMLTPSATRQLTALAERQASYKAAAGAYRTDVPASAQTEGWIVRVLFADATGWAAEAVQGFYPDRSCVVWGGDASRAPSTKYAHLKPSAAGKVVCDPAPM